MTTFVLVHGGCHGAWCWSRIIPQLRAAGHRVIAPDMPGHGIDRTPLKGLTQHDYAAAVESVLLSLDEPAVLVGHSLAGMTVTLVAERCPDRIQKLIYQSAVILSGGRSMMSDPVLGQNLAAMGSAFHTDEVDDTLAVTHKAAPGLFYGDCSPEDIALALSLLTPEPMGGFATPIEVTDAGFGSVPRAAILTLADGIMSPELQRAMYAEHAITEIATLDTSHSPFFSAPDALVRELLTLAGTAAVS